MPGGCTESAKHASHQAADHEIEFIVQQATSFPSGEVAASAPGILADASLQDGPPIGRMAGASNSSCLRPESAIRTADGAKLQI